MLHLINIVLVKFHEEKQYYRLLHWHSPYRLTQVIVKLHSGGTAFKASSRNLEGQDSQTSSAYCIHVSAPRYKSKIMVHKKPNRSMKCDVVLPLWLEYQSTHHWNEKRSTPQ